jgi:hypothetical protein
MQFSNLRTRTLRRLPSLAIRNTYSTSLLNMVSRWRQMMACNWGRSIGYGISAFLLSRLVLAAIAIYSELLQGHSVNYLSMLDRWDASYYLSIAQQGYVPPAAVTGNETGQSNLNFFPLLPLGTWLLGFAVKPLFLAGIIFANICLAAATIVLHRLATLRFDRTAADWSVLSLMLVPGSFAFSTMMTEAPFLAFSIIAAYTNYRGRHGLAALSGGLLTITRLTGIIQAMGFAVDWLIDRWRGHPATYQHLFLICVTPIPLFIYFAYMFHQTGDALAAIHSNFAFWGQQQGVPFQNFAAMLWTRRPQPLLQSIIGLILLVILLSQARHFSAGEWLFLLLSLEIVSSANSLAPSLIRYVIGLYPVHLAMGRYCSRHASGRLLLATLAMINGALAIGWVQGYNIYA